MLRSGWQHKYGNPEIELEKDFDPKGVDLLKGDNWRDVNYKDIKLSKEAIINIKKVKFEEVLGEGNIKFWDKPEGSSEAKQRKRSIDLWT